MTDEQRTSFDHRPLQPVQWLSCGPGGSSAGSCEYITVLPAVTDPVQQTGLVPTVCLCVCVCNTAELTECLCVTALCPPARCMSPGCYRVPCHPQRLTSACEHTDPLCAAATPTHLLAFYSNINYKKMSYKFVYPGMCIFYLWSERQLSSHLDKIIYIYYQVLKSSTEAAVDSLTSSYSARIHLKPLVQCHAHLFSTVTK